MRRARTCFLYLSYFLEAYEVHYHRDNSLLRSKELNNIGHFCSNNKYINYIKLIEKSMHTYLLLIKLII